MNQTEFDNRQKKINTFFNNSIGRNSVPHAFLIEINKSNVIEVIKSAIKKIVCSEGGEYCDKCSYCSRINNMTYSDLIYVDGDEKSITKDEIMNIINRFSYGALDASGYKFYIINKIENANKQSLNSLLKFLEEPTKKTFAFLTTSNPELVLPTIRSRCVYLKPVPSSIDEKIGELLKLGISEEVANIICQHIDSPAERINAIESGVFDKVYEIYKSIASEDDNIKRMIELEACHSLKTDEAKLMVKLLIDLFKKEKNIEAVQYLLKVQSNYI